MYETSLLLFFLRTLHGRPVTLNTNTPGLSHTESDGARPFSALLIYCFENIRKGTEMVRKGHSVRKSFLMMLTSTWSPVR